MISVIVPTYNEPPIASFLDRLAVILEPLGGEIVIVDDSEPEIHERTRAEAFAVRLVAVQMIIGEHRGKGAAVRLAIGKCCGEVIFYLDADTDDERMARIPQFVRMIESDEYDVVIAQRPWKGRTPRRALFAIVLHFLQRFLIFRSPRFFDTQCGFKAFRRNAAQRMASLQTLDGGLFDIEYLAIAVSQGLRIACIPVAETPSVRPSRVPDVRMLPAHLFDLLRVKANLMLGRYSR